MRKRNQQNPEVIREYGIWGLRIALVVGAVMAGIMGKTEVAGGCVTGLIISFFFL